MTGTLGRIGSPAVLWAGVVAPLLFTGVHVVEGATRPRYDPCRHQVSRLSLGPGGWVQLATFLATGTFLTPHGTAAHGGPAVRWPAPGSSSALRDDE